MSNDPLRHVMPLGPPHLPINSFGSDHSTDETPEYYMAVRHAEHDGLIPVDLGFKLIEQGYSPEKIINTFGQ